jgi:hypothetical protein
VRGHVIALLLLAGIIVPASASGALAAAPHEPVAGAGSIGIRLLDAPTAARDDPRARSYIVEQLAPGTSIRRNVEISNSTQSTADVAVYPAAASLSRGSFAFAPKHSRNDLSSWTSVGRDTLHLPPGTKAVETLTVNVPEHASTGERYAVIWAEVSARAPAAGGVTLVNRVGIRMYLMIGPGGAPLSNFVIGPLTAKRTSTGEPLVVADIHNSGRHTLEISGSLTLSKGPGGIRAGPFPITLATTLAPNDSEPATVRLDKQLPRGPWHAHLRLSSGSIQREAEATITFPEVAHRGSHHPILLIILSLVLLTAAAATFLLFRRNRWGRGDFEPAATVSG